MDSNSSFNNFSIVIPIYNEEEILAESINNILSICERTSVEYEIIISENGSTAVSYTHLTLPTKA